MNSRQIKRLLKIRPLLLIGAVTMLYSAAVSAVGQPEQETQLAGARQVFDGRMLPSVEVMTFSHSDTLFPVNSVPHRGAVRAFAPATDALKLKLKNLRFRSGGGDLDLYDYLA